VRASLVPARLFAAVAALALVGACESKPTDLREWLPSDHGHEETQAPEQTGQSDGVPDETAGEGLDDVTLATWSNNCIVCHGRIGRGDGPQAAMVKPRDLSDPAWQASITDEQIAASIVHGKGQMPPFAALPSSTVNSLVKLVRRLSARPEGAAPAASGASAGSSSAPAAPVPVNSAGTTSAGTTSAGTAGTNSTAKPASHPGTTSATAQPKPANY